MNSKSFIVMGLVMGVVVSLNVAAKGETSRSVLNPGDKLGYGQEFPLPGQKGSLVIDLPGFEFLATKSGGDIEEIIVGKRGKTKDEIFFITIKIWIRPYSSGAKDIRDATLKNIIGGPGIKFLKKFEEGVMAFLHLICDEQNMMMGFVCRENIRIEIIVAGEEKGAMEILRSVRFRGR